MRHFRSRDFRAERPWGAQDITELNGISVRLHWTNAPYEWHVNEGEEVFAVLDGAVDMHVKQEGQVRIIPLRAGDVFHAQVGDEHVAHPLGEARILVIEKAGSV
ncbi:cupin [Archangium lipolyticum]|uniref:cupin n=1 Tax=Archangium lipolyticum TaxID=2970465 RepID=UPI00214A1CAD|nr:cupin [Archangium lipolyticum]